MSLVLDFAPEHWGVSTRLVAMALADRVSSETGETWASVGDLARRTGIGHRQVQRHLRILEQDRIILREPRFRDNESQASNRWIWLWTHPATRPLQDAK